jgi:hypothetical protein
MKTLLSLVALGVVLSTSALAQSAPRSRYDANPAYSYGQAVHPYYPDHYQPPYYVDRYQSPYGNNLNPSGER